MKSLQRSTIPLAVIFVFALTVAAPAQPDDDDGPIVLLGKGNGQNKDNDQNYNKIRDKLENIAFKERIIAKALEAHVIIAKAGTTKSAQLALKTIEWQVAHLLFYKKNSLTKALSICEAAIKAGDPKDVIKKAVSEKIEDDHVKYMFKISLDEIAGLINLSKKVNPPDALLVRYANYVSKLNVISRSIVAFKIVTLEGAGHATNNLKRLKLLVGLSGDWGGGHFSPLKIASAIWLLQVETITDIFTSEIRPKFVERNLDQLRDDALVDRLTSKWEGPHEKELFGYLIHSELNGLKKSYPAGGGSIEGKWVISHAHTLDSAWIGLINLPKLLKEQGRDSLDEVVNDEYDLDYVEVEDYEEEWGEQAKKGSFAFQVPNKSGEYAIRVFPSDDGGRLMYQHIFNVR